VDNRLLVGALIAALQKNGADLRGNTPVKAVEPSEDRPAVILDDGSRVKGSCVVLAAGAWSRTIEGIEADARPPVRPVKGQMLQLRMEAPFELKHVVWGPHCYLTPKSSGRLLLGATVEERGFDRTVTAGGLYTLLEAGWRLVPGIYDLEVTETWAGLRPGSRDNEPILGQSAAPGVVFASGHYRNGILLTPVTAEEIARLVMTGETSRWISPFSPHRFMRNPA
jgi:glycine oxidase